MSECTVGGLTVEEARGKVMAYFDANYNLAHEVIYPRQKEPGLEGRESSFILLGISSIRKEHAGMGLREFITDKFFELALWTKAYSGMKETSEFEDFVDSLSINKVEGVVYGEPKALSEKDFKGWVINTILLPFKF